MMKPQSIRSHALGTFLAATATVGLAVTAAGQEAPPVGAPPAGAGPESQGPEGQGTEKPAPEKPAEQKPAPKPQEKEAKKEDKTLRELDPFGGGGPAGGAPGEDEMKELFIKVDKRLQRVTELLFEASTGDGSRSSEVGAAGIDELIREAENASGASASGIAQILEATRSQSEAAKSEIDRILEIAAQNASSSSSGQGSGPPTPQSGMPQQGETPSGSKREEKGEKPEPGEGQPKPEEGKDGKDGEEPKGGEEQEGSEDGPGKKQPKGETGDASNATGNEEWGDLPVHLRKTFQNGVSDDVPPRYRDWVDSYYKRLNRRSGR